MKKRMANGESRVGKRRRKRRAVERIRHKSRLARSDKYGVIPKSSPVKASRKKVKGPRKSLSAKERLALRRLYGIHYNRKKPKITRVRKNPFSRARDKYIIEAMQQKGERRFKFWYWTGYKFNTDKSEALTYPSRDGALAAAKKMLNRLPDSILSLRAVKA